LKPSQQIYLETPPSTATIQRYTYVEALYQNGSTPVATPANVAQWKTINPNLKVYLYRNFESVYTWSAEYAYFQANNMLLKDSAGNLIAGMEAERFVDMGHPLYAPFMKQWVLDNLAGKPYDGVFMDNFVRPTYPGYTTIGINPRKGAPYTDADWFADSMNVLNACSYASTGVRNVGNGIPQGDGPLGYFANKARCDQIIATHDGVCIEGPVCWSLVDFNSRGETAWKQNVDFAKAVIDAGKMCWWSNGNPGNISDNARALYAYCTYLMHAPNPSYCVKWMGSSVMGGSYWTGLVDIDLGAPQGEYYEDALTGDFVKEYSGGVVRVNPVTKAASLTLVSETRSLLLSCELGIPWTVNGVQYPSSVIRFPKNSVVTIEAPVIVES
jgi:hypothetical protein